MTNASTESTADRSVRRNADGRPNLRALRRAVDADPTTAVYRQGGEYVLSRWSAARGAWMKTHLPYTITTERQALAYALGIDCGR